MDKNLQSDKPEIDAKAETYTTGNSGSVMKNFRKLPLKTKIGLFLIFGIFASMPLGVYVASIKTKLNPRAAQAPMTPPTPPTPPDESPTPVPTWEPIPSPTNSPFPTYPPPTSSPVPSAWPSPSPSPVVNLLNPSFEIDNNGDNLPDNWVRAGKAGPTDVRTNVYSHEGLFSFKFIGDKAKNKSLNQTINGNWLAGQMLYISGWVKTMNGIVGGTTRLEVVVKYNDNSSEKFFIVFPNNASYDWTYRSGSFTLRKNANSITVKNVFNKRQGEGYFDHLGLSNLMPMGPSKPAPLKGSPASFEDLLN